MTFKAIATGTAFVMAVASGAMADERYSNYGSTDGWNVFVDHERNSCVMEKGDDDMIVQMGLTKDKSKGYLGVFTKNDPGVAAGDKGDFVFYLDDEVFHGKVTGIDDKITEGFSGAYLLADNPDFIAGVASKHVMKAVNEAQIFELSLEGTKKAMEMGRKCISEQ